MVKELLFNFQTNLRSGIQKWHLFIKDLKQKAYQHIQFLKMHP